ncbi:MAG TPA: hypothetical protein VGL93_08800 [Streptosporangiaceae bacterium]
MSGPKFVLGVVVTALVGFGVPKLAGYLENEAADPVQVHAEFDRDAILDGSVASRGVTPVGVNSPQSLKAFSTNYQESGDLVKVGVQGFKVVIGSVGDSDLTITDMRAVVVKRTPVLAGSLFFITAQGEKNIQLAFELSSPNPVAREVSQRGPKPTDLGIGDAYFESDHVTVGPHHNKVFQLVAYPGRQTYEYKFRVKMVYNGKTLIRTIPAGDRTYRLSGYSRDYATGYQWNGKPGLAGWSPIDVPRYCASKDALCGHASSQ